jgi:hypothetical protein
MAPNKPASRKWTDVQLFLATAAMALTLGLWNMFASPDRAVVKVNIQPTVQPPQPVAEQPAVVAPTPAGPVKILLGGTAPQTQIIVNTGGGNGGGGGGGGGNGGGNTGSS